MEHAKRQYYLFDVAVSLPDNTVKMLRVLATSGRHARIIVEKSENVIQDVLRVKRVKMNLDLGKLFKILKLDTKTYGADPARLYIYQMIGELSPYINNN